MIRIRTGLLAGAAVLASLTATPVSAATPAPRAVELVAPRPAWYTDALDARVRAASARGEGVPVPAAGKAEVAALGMAFAGIRPGGWILSPAGCTTNFVFQTTAGAFDPSQTLYIGTAGHCASVGQSITMVVLDPGSLLPAIVNMGTVTISRNNGVGDDFALIQIKPQFNSWVSPSMAVWGGPTGTYTSNSTTALVHTGHGLVIGTGGTPRPAVLTSSNSTTRYWVGATIFGDSGSAINTASGLAIANITHLVVVGPGPSDSAGTRIERILTIAGKPLSTCTFRTPWPRPGCPVT